MRRQLGSPFFLSFAPRAGGRGGCCYSSSHSPPLPTPTSRFVPPLSLSLSRFLLLALVHETPAPARSATRERGRSSRRGGSSLFLDGCDHCCCVVLLLSPSLKPRIIGRCSLFFSLCQRKQSSASSGRRGRGLKLNKESNFSSSPPTGRRSERRFRGFSSKRLVGFPSPFLVFFFNFRPKICYCFSCSSDRARLALERRFPFFQDE